MDVTIGIATYGDDTWADLADDRAIPSAEAQDVKVVHFHRDTLVDARNAVLAAVTTTFVIHLDADDELEPGYVDAMRTGAADLRAPAVRYIAGGRLRAPYVPRVAAHRHACTGECLTDGNWLVIGTMVRTQILRDAGGWHDYPLYEDWDAWLRCWRAGATIEAIPSAVYRAHVRRDSRNRAPGQAARLAAHRAIAAANQLGAAA